MQNRMQYASKSVIAAADKPAIMAGLRKSGNPAIRRGAESLHRITMMHANNDYNPAMEHQVAGDALFSLPMATIEWLIADYLGEHETMPAAQLNRELYAMREV